MAHDYDEAARLAAAEYNGEARHQLEQLAAVNDDLDALPAERAAIVAELIELDVGIASMARIMGVTRPTIYRWLKAGDDGAE